jgi:RecA/RadA recombinase
VGRKKKELTDAEKIRKSLGHTSVSLPVSHWLDTKIPELNAVFGSEEHGLSYCAAYEISGLEGSGKSLLAQDIAAMAQAEGAEIAWMPLEKKLDKDFARRRGLDPDKIEIFDQRVIRGEGKKAKPRLITGEELCSELEDWMMRVGTKKPTGKRFVCVDSLAALTPAAKIEVSIEDQNMRTMMSHPMLLSMVMPRWAAMAQAFNVMLFCLNQIRSKPGVVFGNPDYTPGGHSPLHYCSSRVQMRRLGRGVLKKGGAKGPEIGFMGVLRNLKNQIGGGSVEHRRAGFIYKFGFKTLYCSEAKVLGKRAEKLREE